LPAAVICFNPVLYIDKTLGKDRYGNTNKTFKILNGY